MPASTVNPVSAFHPLQSARVREAQAKYGKAKILHDRALLRHCASQEYAMALLTPEVLQNIMDSSPIGPRLLVEQYIPNKIAHAEAKVLLDAALQNIFHAIRNSAPSSTPPLPATPILRA